MRHLSWKPILALALIYVGILLGWNRTWGVLFFLWTLPSFYSGRIFLLDEVERESNPVLFWCIIATWTWLSVYLILVDVLAALGVTPWN